MKNLSWGPLSNYIPSICERPNHQSIRSIRSGSENNYCWAWLESNTFLYQLDLLEDLAWDQSGYIFLQRPLHDLHHCMCPYGMKKKSLAVESDRIPLGCMGALAFAAPDRPPGSESYNFNQPGPARQSKGLAKGAEESHFALHFDEIGVSTLA